MAVEWLAYTRKDFLFPSVQKFPHRDPNEETAYLKQHFPAGHAFVMGPLTGDHWFVFVADYLDRPTTECVDRTLDVSARQGGGALAADHAFPRQWRGWRGGW